MKPYQAVLFDLDGTLSDPREGIVRSVTYALNHMGVEQGSIDLRSFIGPPLHHSLVEHFSFTENEVSTALVHYRERYQTRGKFENQLYPGVKLMLTRLQKQGYRLAVATSKPTVFANDILAYFEIADFFDSVVGSELDGTRSDKGEIIAYTLDQLQIEAKAAVMIGDRIHDIEGARRCGVDSVAVSYGYGGEEELAAANATYRVNRVEDLLEWLLEEEKYKNYHVASNWPPVQKPGGETRIEDTDSSKYIALPYDKHLDQNLAHALKDRRTTKEMRRDELFTIQELGNWLRWSVGRVDDQSDKRMYPSAGSLYLNQIYVAVKQVRGLENGLYRYHADGHQLEWINEQVEVEEAFVQADIGFNVCVIVAADLTGTYCQYGERGYRFSLLEAGHIVQNLLVVAGSLRQAVTPIGGFKDDVVNQSILPSEENLSTFYLVPLGKHSNKQV